MNIRSESKWFYQIGLCVRLKSGGPEMLVVDFERNGNVVCAWRYNKSTCEASFPVLCLELV